MSMIENGLVRKYAANRGIELRGLLGSKEETEHIEELRQQIWREKGFELVDGKWTKKPKPEMTSEEKGTRLFKVRNHLQTLSQAEQAWLGWSLIDAVGWCNQGWIYHVECLGTCITVYPEWKDPNKSEPSKHSVLFEDGSMIITEGASMKITNYKEYGWQAYEKDIEYRKKLRSEQK